jgi:Na+/H+ antiporter NhaA
VNVDAPSYDSLWETTLSIDLGGSGVALELREWVNSGLMTFFFFVLGLEARREFDLGELRERRRFALPLLAAIGGMGVAVAIYLAFSVPSLLAAFGLFGVVLVAKALRVRVGLIYFALGAAIWVALLESGVEPVVVGLAMGLLAYAYPAARSDLERATERFREFREQPTPELARSVGIGLRARSRPTSGSSSSTTPGRGI